MPRSGDTAEGMSVCPPRIEGVQSWNNLASVESDPLVSSQFFYVYSITHL